MALSPQAILTDSPHLTMKNEENKKETAQSSDEQKRTSETMGRGRERKSPPDIRDPLASDGQTTAPNNKPTRNESMGREKEQGGEK